MQYVRYTIGEGASFGLLEGEVIRRIEGDLFGDFTLTNQTFSLSQCRLLPPCQPTKVIGIGRNFKHLFPSPQDWPKYPILFLKLPTSVIGPYDPVVYPSLIRGAIFEVELAVVIGRKAVDVPQKQAAEYIFGYACMNDISSREYTPPDLKDYGPGDALVKACDDFGPMGPCLATDIDPSNVRLRAWLNGELKQDANTSDLIFHPYALVSHVSRVITLLPGDVITTGTPAGFVIMRPGDTIECEASGIGRLKNDIRARNTAFG